MTLQDVEIDTVRQFLAARYDRLSADVELASGGTWQDRGLRGTGNTTRLMRAVVRAAQQGITCVVVYEARMRIDIEGKPVLQRECSRAGVDFAAISEFVHFVTIGFARATLHAEPDAMLFVDACAMPDLIAAFLKGGSR